MQQPYGSLSYCSVSSLRVSTSIDFLFWWVVHQCVWSDDMRDDEVGGPLRDPFVVRRYQRVDDGSRITGSHSLEVEQTWTELMRKPSIAGLVRVWRVMRVSARYLPWSRGGSCRGPAGMCFSLTASIPIPIERDACSGSIICAIYYLHYLITSAYCTRPDHRFGTPFCPWPLHDASLALPYRRSLSLSCLRKAAWRSPRQ